MNQEQFNYYMQGAPPQSPAQMRGPNGMPINPAMIPEVMRAMHGQQAQQQAQAIAQQMAQQQAMNSQAYSGTRTRPTPGGYYSMSGPERNQMMLQQAQAMMIRNNPQWFYRNIPGYYNEHGVHWRNPR